MEISHFFVRKVDEYYMIWFVGGLGLHKDTNPLIGSVQIIQNKDIVMKQNTKKKVAKAIVNNALYSFRMPL